MDKLLELLDKHAVRIWRSFRHQICRIYLVLARGPGLFRALERRPRSIERTVPLAIVVYLLTAVVESLSVALRNRTHGAPILHIVLDAILTVLGMIAWVFAWRLSVRLLIKRSKPRVEVLTAIHLLAYWPVMHLGALVGAMVASARTLAPPTARSWPPWIEDGLETTAALGLMTWFAINVIGILTRRYSASYLRGAGVLFLLLVFMSPLSLLQHLLYGVFNLK